MNYTVTEAIQEIMSNKEIGVNQLSRQMGKTPSTVSDRIRQKNISIEKLNEILRLLDYRIVIVPATGSIPKGGYVITDSKEDKE